MLTATYPLPGRMVPDRNGVIQIPTAVCCGECRWMLLDRVQGKSRMALSRLLWNRCPCYDRSQKIVRQLGPSVDSPTAGEANETNHVRRIQEQGMVAVALCRAARHRVPPLLSSCMQHRTFLISEYCSYESLYAQYM